MTETVLTLTTRELILLENILVQSAHQRESEVYHTLAAKVRATLDALAQAQRAWVSEVD